MSLTTQSGPSGAVAAGPAAADENQEPELAFAALMISRSQLIVQPRCAVSLFHGLPGLLAPSHVSLGNRKGISPPHARHLPQLTLKPEPVMQDPVLLRNGLAGVHAVKHAVQAQDSEKEATLAWVNFLMK